MLRSPAAHHLQQGLQCVRDKSPFIAADADRFFRITRAYYNFLIPGHLLYFSFLKSLLYLAELT